MSWPVVDGSMGSIGECDRCAQYSGAAEKMLTSVSYHRIKPGLGKAVIQAITQATIRRAARSGGQKNDRGGMVKIDESPARCLRLFTAVIGDVPGSACATHPLLHHGVVLIGPVGNVDRVHELCFLQGCA